MNFITKLSILTKITNCEKDIVVGFYNINYLIERFERFVESQ